MSRLLARDMQSVTGKNLQFISEMSGLNPWTVPIRRLKSTLVAAEDRWRVPYLCSLLSQRGEAHSLAMEEEQKRLTTLIDSLVAN